MGVLTACFVLIKFIYDKRERIVTGKKLNFREL